MCSGHLESGLKINGGEGALVDVDQDAGLYTIELPDSTMLKHPSTAVKQLKLPEGTWVRLDGLVQRPELNGMCGAIQSFDAATGRYAIHISSSSTSGSSLKTSGSTYDNWSEALLR